MFDVLTIGSATRDVFLESPLFKIVRDPKHLEKLGFPTGEAQCFALGGKIEIGKPTFAIGGGAANAAVTFARQGFRAAAVAKIGNDYVGEEAMKTLKKEGIAPFAIRDKKGVGTSWSAILLSPGGERTILNYRGASETLRTSEIPFSKLKARWAYVVPGHIDIRVVRTIVAALKKNNVKIAMNPSGEYIRMGAKKLSPLLKALDVILVNREEAAALTHAPYHDEKKIFRRFDELVKGIAVMTEGPKGALVSDGRRIYRAGVFADQRVIDRTGAGDAFGSGFVAGLISRQASSAMRQESEAIRYAIRLGSANATSVVERVGAQPGILTRTAFERGARWRRLTVSETLLSFT